ncbi:hypothetical protein EV127DRAFT_477167 [Xylaria flabelliformis]|nr:hypothetical protein EV127DRAFT_477167 [Xylaria flabelliformis]KAI0858409.1 hypothetical protein F4860DRAFT_318163 [Xylaria cubensis]
MKLAIVTLALASGIVAQDLGALPDCAKDCLAKYTTGNQIGSCARLDAKCICANNDFINGIACCLAGVCDADEQNKAVDFARSFCSTQGVTNLPQSVTCASASSGTTTPTTAPSSTTTPTETATVTPNAGCPAGLGSSAGFYGGLLAALAML